MPMPVLDEASVVTGDDGRSRFYAAEQLGEQRGRTPEGFLLCLNVPICRTGTQLYHAKEMDGRVSSNADGIVRITRNEDEVFREEHVVSYNGKPVVNDHPTRDVIPLTWREVAVGTVLNPRRGTGLFADCIVADFIIYDEAACGDVESGKREVSCGYDADYVEESPGVGLQKNLLGNHVALVDAGRCGPRCSIGDHSSCTGDSDMRFTDARPAWLDKLVNALKTNDAAAIATAEAEAVAAVKVRDEGNEGLHLHLGGESKANDDYGPRMDALEEGHAAIMAKLDEMSGGGGSKTKDADEEEEKKKKEAEAAEKATGDQLEEEAPAGTKDARKMKDSAFLGDSFQETLALAEILMPGVRLPTYDAALAPKATLDTLCGLRRTTLDLAYNTADGRGLIDELLGAGKVLNLDSLSCTDVRKLFLAAGALKKTRNNDGTMRREVHVQVSGGGLGVRSKINTPAEMNKRNRELYGPH